MGAIYCLFLVYSTPALFFPVAATFAPNLCHLPYTCNMRKNRGEIFHNLAYVEPPHGLAESVIVRIMRERRRWARTRVFFLAASACISCAAFIPALEEASREFSQSGFYQYFSLAFSDGSVLFASWKEFSLLLAESLPLMGITLVLAALFVLLASIRLMARDVRVAFFLPRFR